MKKTALQVMYYGTDVHTAKAVAEVLESDRHFSELLNAENFSAVEVEIHAGRVDVLLVEIPITADEVQSVLHLVKQTAVVLQIILLVNDFSDPMIGKLLEAGAFSLIPVTAPQLLLPLLNQLRQRKIRIDADFARLFENSPDLIFAKNQDGVFTHVNQIAATIFQRPSSDIIGRTNREIMSARDAVFWDRLEHQALRGNIVSQKMPVNGKKPLKNIL